MMPKEEIFFRIAECRLEKEECRDHVSKKDRLSDKAFITKCCGLLLTSNVDQALFDHFWSGERDSFFTELCSKEVRLSHIKKHLSYRKSLDEADRMCRGKLTLLGRDVDLAGAGEWHKDPIEGCEWPRVFYKKVTKEKPSVSVDIKYVWEMNRHQYLIVLGKAYWMTGDEKYAEKVRSIIESWISDNPYHCGVNWSSSLELAVRSISWIWAYFFCRNSKHMSPKFHFMFLKSIYEHGLHIEQHLSYYSSPYNHLIGEAAGLHLIGSLFSQLKAGQKWERLGWSILEEHIDKQFFDDGMCVEQATFYHHFTLGFYLQAVLLRQANKKVVSGKVLSAIEKALEASMYMTKPDGELPAIGDIDNARSLYFSPAHSWDFRGFLSVGAILFNRPDFKCQSNGFSEELLWLCDDAAVTAFRRMGGSPPKECSKDLSSSGYYVMRNSWEKDSHYLCFDCGKIAEGLHENDVPSAAHGHADALSFELSAYGKPILAEGGFFTYFGALAWHRYFREETAHNTIKIGRHRQAEYCGRLTWKSIKNPKLNHWQCTEEIESVSGSIRYDKKTVHRRDIMFVDSRFWILSDHLETASNSDTATAYFHFDSCVEIEVDRSKRQVQAINGEVGLLLQYFDDYEVKANRGGAEPESGWQAHGYGYKTPAWVLSFDIPLRSSSVIFPMLLLPWRGNTSSFSLEGEPCALPTDEEVFSPAFSFSQQHYVVSFRQDTSPSVLCNGVAVSR